MCLLSAIEHDILVVVNVYEKAGDVLIDCSLESLISVSESMDVNIILTFFVELTKFWLMKSTRDYYIVSCVLSCHSLYTWQCTAILSAALEPNFRPSD